MRRTGVSAWMLCSAVLQAGETPLYHTDFSAPLGGDWQVLDGRAAVEDGRLTVRSDRSNPFVRLNRTFHGDLSVRLRLLRGPGSHWSGVVVKDTFWLTLQNEFAAVLLVRRQPDKPQETKELARIGNWTAFVEDFHDFELRLDCQGSKVRAFLDGLLAAEVEDPDAPEAGGLALVGGWSTDVAFDDLAVRRFDPTMLPKPGIVPLAPTLAEMRAQLDRRDAIYGEGETVRVAVSWRAADAGEVALALRLIDVDGQVVATEQRRVQQRPGQPTGFSLAYSKLPRGVFKLALDRITASGLAVHQSDVTSFAILPRRQEEQSARDDSPFGAHPHWEVPEFHYPLARKLGVRWARNHDAIQYTWWVHAQPAPNRWRWFDDELALLQQNGLSLLGAFMTVPGWASGGSNTGYGSAKPPDLQLFGRYVHEVVGHYKDRIRVWEIWNEPHFRGFWDGTPEQYAAMAAVAYREAKRADPQCRVIGGGGVSLDPDSLRWAERAFAAGLLQSCDAISFHYGYQGSAVPGPRKRFLTALATLRSMMRAHGGEKPLWNTEAAVPSTSFLDQYRAPRPESEAPYHFHRAADAVVQMLAVNLAGGVKKVFYYDLVWPRRDGWIVNLTAVPVQGSMLEGHGGPKPLAVAYATAAALLDGTQFVAALEPAPSVPVYLFRRGQESVAVLWAEVGRDGGPLRLRLEHEGAWELADVMNRPTECGDELRVGRSPVFVIARSDPEAFQRAWSQARVAAGGL